MEHQNTQFEFGKNTPPNSIGLEGSTDTMKQSGDKLAPPGGLSFENSVADRERQMSHRVEANTAPLQAQLPAVPADISAATVIPDPATPAIGVTTPIVAADVDLIEREWVDKVKNVIAETRDDPYRREQEVKTLQADYIRKRYGRELGGNNG